MGTFGNTNAHGRVNVIIQPANALGQLQTSIDQSATPSSSVSTNNDNDDNQSSETIAALENKYVSKAFEDLYRRGVNPLRAEILLVNELIPIGTGENHEDNQPAASINLNYGEGTNLKVNQVMRLIDLQRIIRKNMLKLSGGFLEEFIGITNGTQKILITNMHTVLKANIDQFVALDVDTELMVVKLLDLAADNAGGSIGVDIAKFIQRVMEENSITSLYLRSIARYVILDYIAQNTIKFISRIYDLKNTLSEAISIDNTRIKPPATNNENELTAQGTQSFHPSRINSAIKLLRLFGMPEHTSEMVPMYPAGYEGNTEEGISSSGYSWGKMYMLSEVINSNLDDNNSSSGFGSNLHMYTHLFANILKNMSFMQTLSADQPKIIDKSKVSFTRGTKNLAAGLKILKSITAVSMSSGTSELRAPSGAEALNGSKLEAMLDAVSDSKTTALNELVTAACYDQVVLSNINGSEDKFINSSLSLLNSAFRESPFIDYFNSVFFKTGITTWDELSDQNLENFDYKSFAKNSEKLGTYLKERFEPKDDDGLKYMSSEHSYKDNVHRSDNFVSGPDYYFNKAVSSENISFAGLNNDANKLLNDVDEIVHDIAAMFGLDFKAEDGQPAVGNLNAYTDDNSPLGYFHRMCDKLGAEARKTGNDIQNSSDLSIPLMHAGSFDDMEFTADAIKASYFGAYRKIPDPAHRGHKVYYQEDPAHHNTGDSTVFKSDGEDLANLVVKAEHVRYIEEKLWVRLFMTKLSGVFKDRDPSTHLITKELKYLANQQINEKGNVFIYDSIIHNGTNKNGIGEFSTSENGIKVTFGKISGHRADYIVEEITRNKVDNQLDLKLNIHKTGKDKGRSLDSSGVGFSKEGLFEEFLLANEALYPPSVGERATVDNTNTDISGINDVAIGANAKRDATRFKHATGNNPDHNPDTDAAASINYMIRPVPNNASGKKVDWNDKAGEYGGIFKTTTASRYTLFTLFFARMYHLCLGAIYEGQESELHIHYFPSHWAGMADALERKGKDPAYSSNGTHSEGKRNYDHAYREAKNMITMITNNMEARRKSILKNLEFIKQNSREIKAAIAGATKILNGSSGEISKGEKLSVAYLKKIGFMKTGLTFLNECTAGALLKNYQKNYLLDFHSSDLPSSDSQADDVDGVATYPYFKLEGYDIRELKIMAKLFSEKGRALTSSIDDKIGRKSIMHIGIPNGTLRYLQNKAYNKTGELEYYHSNNILIHITKKNSLDPQIKYQSRSYVFNMSKHIATLKSSDSYTKIQMPGTFSEGNHLKNYNDDWAASDIKSNVEILTADSKKPHYNLGVTGISAYKDLEGAEKIDSIYDDYVYEEMLENHLYDHYSKLYTNVTTGIDMSETMFPLDSNKLFDGKVDPAASESYSLLGDELIKRYPAANIIPSVSQEFYRMLRIMKSSLYFSSEARFESFVTTQCFDRVFSIPVSERDFALKLSAYNIDATDVYKPESMPKLTLTSKKMISINSIANVTGEDEDINNSESDLFNLSPAKLVLEYGKGLNNNKTDVSTFVVEIAILKSSKES